MLEAVSQVDCAVTSEELTAVIGEYDACLTIRGSPRLTAPVLEAADKLKFRVRSIDRAHRSVHIHESLYQDGRIDPNKLQPVSRLAGDFYSKLGELFSIKRPQLDTKLKMDD